jgi:hypothetical protein
MSMENTMEWYEQEETKELGENLSQCYAGQHSSNMDWSGPSPGGGGGGKGGEQKAITTARQNTFLNNGAIFC